MKIIIALLVVVICYYSFFKKETYYDCLEAAAKMPTDAGVSTRRYICQQRLNNREFEK